MSAHAISANAAHDEPTILDAADRLAQLKLPTLTLAHDLHIFPVSPPPLEQLRTIAQDAFSIAMSLQQHQSLVLTSKTVSGLKQQTTQARMLKQTSNALGDMLQNLRDRPGNAYGEDVPLDRNVLPWIVDRLEAWGREAGMEVFHEFDSGDFTCALAGKVVVVDVVLGATAASDGGASRKCGVKQLKISYAVGADATATPVPTFVPSAVNPEEKFSLETVLGEALDAFVGAVQGGSDITPPDAVTAKELGQRIKELLSQLMQLDNLSDETKQTEQWFTSTHSHVSLAWDAATAETAIVSSEFDIEDACPLDVFLVRAHSLPLPYLTGTSLSFLVHASPMSYLRLMRAARAAPPSSDGIYDLPLPLLRSKLKDPSFNLDSGLTWATLALSPLPTDLVYTSGLQYGNYPAFDARVNLGKDINGGPHMLLEHSQLGYWLTFEGGVVVNEVRMRDIQHILGTSSQGGTDFYEPLMIRYLWSGSWIDLLLKGQGTSQAYTATYQSPHRRHPPLRLRLTSSNEPGFILGKVPVKSIEQVWAVLEIVRDQVWINQLLKSVDWIPEAPDVPPLSLSFGSAHTLDGLLSGSYEPEALPVNVTVGEASSGPEGTAASDAINRPMLQMVVPTRRRPGDPILTSKSTIDVTLEPTKPRGVLVQVDGRRVDRLDEVVRRGGTFGIPGRVWAGLVNG